MAYIIAEPCINVKDGACVEVCPVDCIHSDENAPQFYINPDECINCGVCEPVCPVGAIVEPGELPVEWEKYAQINADFFDTNP